MMLSIHSVFDLPPADPVAAKLPFLGSAWSVSILLAVYLLFVQKIGKDFMEIRQPYNVKNIIIVYNACQVIYNAIMFCYVFYYIILIRVLDFRCMSTLPLDHPLKHIELAVCYAYYINKILDLLDTIFFVLRKSYKQVSFLHVYHHVMQILLIYCVARFYGFGGQFVMVGLYNTFVHTIMYSYYLISALNSGIKGSWWKKYITLIQIIQFTLLIIHSIAILIFNPNCAFPKVLQYLQLLQSTFFAYLFTKFYIKSYMKPQHKKDA